MRISRIFTAFTTAVLLLFCSCKIPADTFPTVHAEEVSDSIELPEWVPQSDHAAYQFFTLHGGTYIQDNLLCVTFCKSCSPNDSIPKAEYIVSVTEGVMKKVFHEQYRISSNMDIEIFVYKPVSAGSFKTSLTSPSADTLTDFDGNIYIPSYDFFVDDMLNITETDLYAKLPDCITEFEEFYKEHDTVSVIDDKIVFCLPNPTNMFSKWQEGYCSENIRQTAKWSCSKKTEFAGFFGGPRSMADIAVYEAVSEGPVYVRWDVVDIYHPDDIYYGFAAAYQDTSFKTPALSKGDARIKITDYETGEPVIIDEDTDFSINRKTSVINKSTLISPISSNPCVIPDLCKPVKGFQSDESEKGTIPLIADALDFNLVIPDEYEIPKDEFGVEQKNAYMTITVVNGEAYDIEYRIAAKLSGDVNGDSEFNTADLVTLQKWLLGKSDTVLKNWKAADYCNDNVIDSFDLCLMRKALIIAQQEPPITLFVLDQSRTYNTEKGVEERRIITCLENTDFEEKEDILSLTQKISDNIDKYENMKLKQLDFSIADYGEDVLYLVYRKPDQEPDRMVICTYGESCSWLDDKDVQELVILLIENGYFAAESDTLAYKEAQ
ncbi:dockerin type I repeat-containing protein [Ruminococcus sp.]|uniref:dockerin type I repeat-containing protein n=1 Tax=Ruminococcus sp. TaxID=41978 RepID=UPI0025D47524|nr:dockerin type I repeat-containing protein [Ruminococcus sp.]